MHTLIPAQPGQEKNARLTGRAGTHYFWEFLMLFLAVFCGFWQRINWNIKLKKTGRK